MMLDRKTLKNTLSLYGLHFATYIPPLIILPYLARTISPETLGIYYIAQNLFIWFSMIIGYGFDLSATRRITKNRDNIPFIGRLVVTIAVVKVCLALVCSVLFVLLCSAIPVMRGHLEMMIWGLIIGILEGFIPTYYFHGYEKIRYASMLNVAMYITLPWLAVMWINNDEQTVRLLILNAVFRLLIGLVQYGYILSKLRGYRFEWPRMGETWAVLREGFPLFFVFLAQSFYTNCVYFLMGYFSTPRETAMFANGDKLTKIGLSGYQPLNAALYPVFNRLSKEDRSGMKKRLLYTLLFMLLVSSIAALVLVLSADWLVLLVFANRYQDSIPVFQMLCATLPCMAITYALGTQYLLVTHREKIFNKITLMAGLICIVLCCILIPLYHANGAAIAIIIAEFSIALSLIYFSIFKYQLAY